MADTSNSTPITNLVDNTTPVPTPPQTQVKYDPISVSTTKESGSAGMLRSEASVEHKADDEQKVEQNIEKDTKHEVKKTKEHPDIHPDAAKAGVQIAPAASPFPTIYDVKVPVLKDDEIEKNLHGSFWSGARWLAEVCKYILWQAHIKLRKVGNKTVRERISQPF